MLDFQNRINSIIKRCEWVPSAQSLYNKYWFLLRKYMQTVSLFYIHCLIFRSISGVFQLVWFNYMLIIGSSPIWISSTKLKDWLKVAKDFMNKSQTSQRMSDIPCTQTMFKMLFRQMRRIWWWYCLKVIFSKLNLKLWAVVHILFCGHRRSSLKTSFVEISDMFCWFPFKSMSLYAVGLFEANLREPSLWGRKRNEIRTNSRALFCFAEDNVNSKILQRCWENTTFSPKNPCLLRVGDLSIDSWSLEITLPVLKCTAQIVSSIFILALE